MERGTERTVPSDAAWYCRKDAEEERFYEIFFKLCRKYGVSWAGAGERERCFIEELTRVTYERDRAVRLGLPLDEIRPAFSDGVSESSNPESRTGRRPGSDCNI